MWEAFTFSSFCFKETLGLKRVKMLTRISGAVSSVCKSHFTPGPADVSPRAEFEKEKWELSWKGQQQRGWGDWCRFTVCAGLGATRGSHPSSPALRRQGECERARVSAKALAGLKGILSVSRRQGGDTPRPSKLHVLWFSHTAPMGSGREVSPVVPVTRKCNSPSAVSWCESNVRHLRRLSLCSLPTKR